MTKAPGTWRQRDRKRIAVALAVPAILVAGALSAGAEPPEGWDVEHAEISAERIVVGAADSGTMPDGSYRMFAVTNAVPDARLVEIDPWEGVVVASHDLTGSTGSWGVHVGADGTVWAGSYSQGIVYELPWEAETPIAHPRATPDTSFVWQVDTDEDGNLYAGTFEGWAENGAPGRLIRIAPDGEQHVYEPFGDTEQYVRSTAVVGDRVYAGTGAGDGRIYEVDPATGEREVIALPEEIGSCGFVYELYAVGNDLAARFQQCEGAEPDYVGYVLDLDSRTWYPGEIPVSAGAISQPDDDGTLYVGAEGRIQGFDPETGVLEPLSESTTSGTKDVELTVDPVTGANIVISLAGDGKLIRHDIDAGTYTELTVAGLTGDTGRTARTAVVGPDDAYYVSLRTSGGLGRFDPLDGTWTFEPGIGQAQGMTVHDDLMYIGLYPSARIMAYDPSEAWSEENPQELFRLADHGQDRPFAMVSAGDLLAIGTVPYYGGLTGALTLYDPATEELTVHTDPFTDRSITALTHREGILYGGTTIYGSGATPVHTEGTAFAWDVASETMLWETVPLPGEAGIGTITADEYGRLFAASVGQVVELDPLTGTPLQAAVVTDDTSDQLRGAWHISDLSYNEVEGALYLSTRTEVIRLSPSTLADITPVATTGELLRVADDGTNFWMSGRAVHTGTLHPLAEATVVEPLPVTFVDEPGTSEDVIVVPDAEGVRYLLEGEELPPGEHGAVGEAVVTAAPAEGFRIADVSRWWSHTFDTDDETEPAPEPEDPGPEPSDSGPSDPGAGTDPGDGTDAGVETDPDATEMPATGVSVAGTAVLAILALLAGSIALVSRRTAIGS